MNTGYPTTLSNNESFHKEEQEVIPITVGSWTFIAVVYDELSKSALLFVDGHVITFKDVNLSPGGPDLIIGGNGRKKQKN